MIISTSVAVLGLSTFTLPTVRRRVQLGAVSALALMLVLVQLTIADIDRPYDGLIAVEPVDIERVADDLSEDYPTRPLPCDPSGNEV